MKKRIFYGLCLWFSALCAPAALAQVYVEGSLGFHNVDSVSVSQEPVSGSNVKIQAEYDVDVSPGIELGVGFAENFRVGIFYSKFKADVEVENITATVGGVSVPPEAFSELTGLSGSDDIKLVMINGYYDFNGGDGLTPFIGAGFGKARTTDLNRDVLSIHGGVKYAINESVYVGGKLSLSNFDATEDEGVKYGSFKARSFHLMLGAAF